MSDGKGAPGLKGFPTPNSVAGSSGYTVFRFPNDAAWGQLVLGAMQALTQAYNWYESGDMTPDEAAEAFRLLINQAPYNGCGFDNPAGGKVIRIASNGHVQELGESGDWGTPSGDYEIPPITEREGGTPEDQMCLAAANAANVLQLLYEELTDAFNDGLDEAEALTALMLLIVSLIGAAFAPITFAIVTFFSWVFSVLYATLEFVGADLWDSTFTDALKCILLGCASNDEGIVTFDWTCFNDELAAQTNVFELTFEQLRLFGQIQYMLSVIGGVDALNAAGATTAITEADCSACTPTWCFDIDFTIESGSGYGFGVAGGAGHWVSGQGWYGDYIGVNNEAEVDLRWVLASSQFTVASFTYYKSAGSGGNDVTHFQMYNPYPTTVVASNDANEYNPSGVTTKTITGDYACDGMRVDINSGNSAGAEVKVISAHFEGTGDSPFGSSNC